LNRVWVSQGTFTINSDTPATSLPALLGITTPSTDADLLVFQALAEDAYSSANDAEAALADTQALFNGFDSSVASSVSLSSPANIDWDVDAPFNDGNELKKGYGTRNTYGNKATTFSRSSATGSVNKTGVYESLAVDAPLIGNNGIGLHPAYSNTIPYSTFSGGYPLGSASNWNNTLKTINGVVFNGLMTSPALRENVVPANSSFTSTIFMSGEGNSTTSALRVVSSGTTSVTGQVTITWATDSVAYDIADTGFSFFHEKIADKLYRVCISYNATVASLGNTTARYVVYNDGSNSAYFGGMQLVSGLSALALPYLQTTGASSVSRSTDVMSLPVSGNLPSTGRSFTIMMDASFTADITSYPLITISSNVTGGDILFRKVNGQIQWYHDLADGSLGYLFTSNTAYAVGSHRYALRFDSGVFSLFCDGILVSSRTAANYCWFSPTGTISFSGSYANYLKNFRISQSALTDDQIKALGGYPK